VLVQLVYEVLAREIILYPVGNPGFLAVKQKNKENEGSKTGNLHVIVEAMPSF